MGAAVLGLLITAQIQVGHHVQPLGLASTHGVLSFEAG